MRIASTALLGAALLSMTAAAARADPIAWYYSWSRTPTKIYADNSANSYITLSAASQTKQAETSSTIQATNVFHYGGASNGLESPLRRRKHVPCGCRLLPLANAALVSGVRIQRRRSEFAPADRIK